MKQKVLSIIYVKLTHWFLNSENKINNVLQLKKQLTCTCSCLTYVVNKAIANITDINVI